MCLVKGSDQEASGVKTTSGAAAPLRAPPGWRSSWRKRLSAARIWGLLVMIHTSWPKVGVGTETGQWNTLITAEKALTHQSTSCSILSSLLIKDTETLPLQAEACPGGSSPYFSGWEPHGLRPQTPTEPHHLQKAETSPLSSQTSPPPLFDYNLR